MNGETMEQFIEAIELTSSYSTIDWNEIIYIFIGAIIGFVASIIVMVVERSLDRKGKINIFYRCIQHPGSSSFPINFVDKSEYVFLLPIKFEIQNTSNIPRVIRNVDVLLYRGKNFVGRMSQIESVKPGSERTQYDFGDEKSSYSFNILPRSIQTQICDFIFCIRVPEMEEKKFDTVVIRYYNEKNKPQTFKLMNIPNCWEEKWYNLDTDWKLLKDKIRIRK